MLANGGPQPLELLMKFVFVSLSLVTMLLCCVYAINQRRRLLMAGLVQASGVSPLPAGKRVLPTPSP